MMTVQRKMSVKTAVQTVTVMNQVDERIWSSQGRRGDALLEHREPMVAMVAFMLMMST